MTAKILLLGHDKDYYATKTDHDSVALAVPKALKMSGHMDYAEAVMEYIADRATVIPADQLHHYGASFMRSISATVNATMIDKLNRLFEELLAEAEHHKADYVLIHAMSFERSILGGTAITAWAQLLNIKQGGLSSKAPPPSQA